MTNQPCNRKYNDYSLNTEELKIYEENLGLVGYVYKKNSLYFYQRCQTGNYDREDLMQYGYIGLIKAIKGFDESKGFTFATFACHMIKGEIRKFLRDVFHDRRYKKGEFNGYAREMGNFSLSSVIHQNCNTPITLGDKLALDYNLEDSVLSNTLINDFCKILTERESTILRLAIQDVMQKDIGKVVGTSQVQISRILTKIKEKYRIWMKC